MYILKIDNQEIRTKKNVFWKGADAKLGSTFSMHKLQYLRTLKNGISKL